MYLLNYKQNYNLSLSAFLATTTTLPWLPIDSVWVSKSSNSLIQKERCRLTFLGILFVGLVCRQFQEVSTADQEIVWHIPFTLYNHITVKTIYWAILYASWFIQMASSVLLSHWDLLLRLIYTMKTWSNTKAKVREQRHNKQAPKACG